MRKLPTVARSLAQLQREANRTIYGPLIWVAVAVLAVLSQRNVYETDLFLHLNLGQWMLHGGAPTGDPAWIYGPADSHWTNTMVPAELVMAVLHAGLGWWGVSLLSTLGRVLLLLSIWYAMLALAPSPARKHHPLAARYAFVTAVSLGFVLTPIMTVRPQTMLVALVPVLLVVLLRIIHAGHLPRILPTVLATWVAVNWHGYAALVAPLLALAIAAHVLVLAVHHHGSQSVATTLRQAWVRNGRRALILIAGTAATTVLTPAGVGFYAAAMKLRERGPHLISEWQSVHPFTGTGWLVTGPIVVWLAAAVFALLRNRNSRAAKAALAGEALFLAGIVAMFGFTVRMTMLGFLIIVLIAAQRWLRSLPRGTGFQFSYETLSFAEPRRWTVLLPSLLIAGIAVALGTTASTVTIDDSRQPVHLWESMGLTKGPHRVLVDWDVSSSTLYYLRHAPTGGSVSIDGRTDRYSTQTLNEYFLMDFATLGDAALRAWTKNATDAIVTDVSTTKTQLVKAGWTVHRAQPGRTPKGEKITWFWLKAPTDASIRG